MSTKKNALVAVAAAALALTMTAGAHPVPEGLLNDYSIKGVGIAQVNQAGGCIMIVTVAGIGGAADQVRPVCAANGDVKLYGGIDMTASVLAKAKLQSSVVVHYKRMEKESTAGDPVNTLKSQYKSFKTEKATADKNIVELNKKKSAADGLGWNTAVGTPEAVEYADIVARISSVTEWKDYAQTRITALAASLTAAGIDPATVV